MLRCRLLVFRAVTALLALAGGATLAQGGSATSFRAPSLEAQAVVAVTPGRLVAGGKAHITYQRSDLAGRHLFAHYGFNGWNLPLTGAGAGSSDDRGNLNFFAQRAMAETASGNFALDVDVPTAAKAMHFVFCWDACGAGQWDSNGPDDWARGIAFPYIGPTLTWNEATAPESGVVVQFEEPVAAAAWVEYGVDGGATTRLADTSNTLHRFVLTGLTPATRYHYRVGLATGEVSAEAHFRTAPPRTAQTKLTFAIFGDAQDNGEDGRFSDIVTEVATHHADVDFVLSTGDLPWNDMSGDWWSFFDKGRVLFSEHVVMPVVGNHDTPTVGSNYDHSHFVRHFALPHTGGEVAFYRFAFGPATFFGMNSERPPELVPGGVQHEWLASQLAERRSAQAASATPLWNFAYWHIPPFNAGSRHASQMLSTRPITGLFPGILDWHFGGHEHLYQRFEPLDLTGATPKIAPRYGVAAGEGLGFLLVPSSGTMPEKNLVSTTDYDGVRGLLAYPRASDITADAVEPVRGFARVTVDGASLAIDVYGVPEGGAAKIIDQVRYTK